MIYSYFCYSKIPFKRNRLLKLSYLCLVGLEQHRFRWGFFIWNIDAYQYKYNIDKLQLYCPQTLRSWRIFPPCFYLFSLSVYSLFLSAPIPSFCLSSPYLCMLFTSFCWLARQIPHFLSSSLSFPLFLTFLISSSVPLAISQFRYLCFNSSCHSFSSDLTQSTFSLSLHVACSLSVHHGKCTTSLVFSLGAVSEAHWKCIKASSGASKHLPNRAGKTNYNYYHN